ncbi:MAG TPA: hypothetical protein VGU25_11000 [Acidobacteriaceae bacterium]|nr:hypothetical protein [Acidobacteriaceae bacterium]
MRACRIMARMTSRTVCAFLCSAALYAVTAPAGSQTTAAPPAQPPAAASAKPPANTTSTPAATPPAPPAANTKFISARALYYTPTAQGLRSFKCTVDFNWKDFLTRYSGSDIKDDNPFLQYLRAVHLSVTDELNSDGHLEWANAASPPAGKEDAATKMKEGMEQMMTGFFSSWNAYMNGNMVPIPDATTTITETPDGFRLHATSTGTEVTELYDKNLLLTEAHVVQPSNDVYAYPTYADTPDGRLVSAIRTVFRQPPTAPPAELNITVSYAPVQGFRLPASLAYDLKNVGSFEFRFSACSTETAKKVTDDTE